ncbi:MAG TPA: hypothetical protein VFD48_07635 [Pyrinomonadaceae bacterium]|nr:hypothetical protein [Pyrinomonadaceae bacterium]
MLYEGGPEALVAPTSLYKVRVDDVSGAFELLARESGVTVTRNGTSSLRIDTDEESISALNALLVAHGVKVYELSPAQENLEEAFLRLTKIEAAPSKEKP